MAFVLCYYILRCKVEKEVNFDVLNTLYLIKESLGDSYLEEDFNPFGDDFVLNQNSVKRYLEVKTEKKQVKPPEFVDKSEEEILSALKFGTANTKKVLTELGKQEQTSSHLQHIVVYLKIRLKMFADLDKKNINYEELVDVMQTLEALDSNYAKILKKSFEKNFNIQLAIKQFLQLCKQKEEAKTAKKVEQKKKQQQTQQIQHTVALKKQKAVKRPPPKPKKVKDEEMSM